MPNSTRSWMRWIAFSLLVSAGIAGLVRGLKAQPAAAPASPASVMTEQLVQISKQKTELKIVEKFAKVLQLENRIASVYGFDADVINVTKVDRNPRQIRLHALSPGITTMVLVDEFNTMFTLDVMVDGDVRHLQAHINKLFPDSSVEVVEVKDNASVVLRGWVTQPEHITSLVEVAEQFYPKVLNQMQVGGVQQVQLHVKVMEVQRSKIRQFGLNFLYVDNNSYFASTPGQLTPLATAVATPGGLPAATVDAARLTDPTMALGLVGENWAFQGFLEALKQEGLLKIQAQPVLVTTNGRPATMTNGGEFPVLVPQGLGTVSIEWREFGVRLEAVPVILGGGRLRLELMPEVSERDFTNAVNINGLVVPGLTTRRVNTQVEMRFGETLMIAGLIAHRKTASTSKIPFLGEVPYLGAAFSRKQYDEVETELVIMVTPEYVAPMASHQVPANGPGTMTTVPLDRELYLDGLIEVPNYGEPCEDCQPGVVAPGMVAPGMVAPPMAPMSPMYTPTPSPLMNQPMLPPPSPSPVAPPAPPAEFDELGAPGGPTSQVPMRGTVRRGQTTAQDGTEVPTFHFQTPGYRELEAKQGMSQEPGLIGPSSGATTAAPPALIAPSGQN